MKKEEIKLEDIKRILIGNSPLEFLPEVFFRTVILYIFFLVILRLMGKRMTGMLTIIEMSVLLTLGAIIAPAMQLPDRGLLQALVPLVLILVFQRLLVDWGARNQKVERITQGKLSLLVKDGVLQLKELEETRIPRTQLFATLRSKRVYNLGKVQRLYLEACGAFSLYPAPDHKPGLSVLPEIDDEHGAVVEYKQDLKACSYCGNTVPSNEAKEPCDICTKQQWVDAVA